MTPQLPSRMSVRLTALLAIAASSAAIAAPAQAAPGQGTATLTMTQQAKGKSLSAQGVKTSAIAPATKSGPTVSLPVSNLELGGEPAADVSGGLRFAANGKTVKLTGLRLSLSAATVTGTLGEKAMTVFRFSGAPVVEAAAGAVKLSDGSLRLTGSAAKALRTKLGLEKAIAKKNAGAATLSASTPVAAPLPSKPGPSRAAAKSVVSGAADWGILASWRAYVLGQQGPPMSKGTISAEEGGTASANMAEGAAFFGFPAATGSFEKGLNGATDRLSLTTTGAAVFKKPFHCINELKLKGIEVTIDGADSALSLDSYHDIGKVNGMSCEAQPPASGTDVEFATLDVSSVSPAYSPDGKTITWTAIPATLTEAGTAAFGAGYEAGQALDPVTVTVSTG